MLDDQYYIRSRGRVQGPYTTSRLKELAKRGQFSRHHHISHDRENWERASAHPELFPDVGPRKERRLPPGSDLFLGAPVEEMPPGEPASDAREMVNEGAASGAADWYYTHKGTQIDTPVAFSQLQFLVSTGQLTHEDNVWTDGMPNWTPASTIPDLFPWLATEPEETLPKIVVEDRKDHVDGPQSTAPMAVASFVLGLLGTSLLFFFGSILAIVFGHIALKQIVDSKQRLGGRGLAIAGLILGYIVLAIGIIVGIFMLCFSLLAVDSTTT
ncbi:MAG: DUF4339 domain-containing protein [Planctomycetaceae bacterium]|nr:DUF4339 domain-containing protein [Planctomycetales bacterium]MCB9926485.1 DUF4339 domain-containing protein [Planctomycetaceae bacterium]